MFDKFSWEKSQLLYEKTFWETELREAGFCKLLMNVSFYILLITNFSLNLSNRFNSKWKVYFLILKK